MISVRKYTGRRRLCYEAGVRQCVGGAAAEVDIDGVSRLLCDACTELAVHSWLTLSRPRLLPAAVGVVFTARELR